MKRFLLIAMMLASVVCLAATGSASDGELALITVILLLMLPVAVAYLTHFIKHRIHEYRTHRMLDEHLMDHNGEAS